MNVPCTIVYDEDVEVDPAAEDAPVEVVRGVCVTCTRCGNIEENPGNSEASVDTALAALKRSCPRREDNHYYSDEA